ncbi:MAG TPA: hypothetical protein PKI77_01400, partial [Mycobacterium sp.]|nr:hypothetical protein [Mycobacterium sp.]
MTFRAASAETSSTADAPAESASVVAVAAAVLDTIFFPYTTPTIPTGSWLDILIATVWRDISHTLFNKTPVATYTSEELLLSTVYTMDVVDPNGDPLSFAIIQPEHGLVTWVPFTNKFIYTPDLFYTGDPVTETFQIIFSDSKQNDKTGDWLHDLTHSLARSWGLAQADDLTVTIPVLVKPVYAAPLVTTLGAPSFTLQGQPVKLLASASIIDADSTELSGATVKLTTLTQDGDQLIYTQPVDSPVTGTWDDATNTLTLSGTATLGQYEEALKAITFTATQGAFLVRGVEIWVTDTSNTTSLTPGVALVNVFNPLAPAVGVAGAPSFTLQGDPVTVLSSVTITDGDSTELSSATMKLTTLSQDGDQLIYTQPVDNPITGSWDAATKTMTLSGTASIAQYEEALKAITFTATQGALLVRGVEVWVTDTTQMESLLPGVALVNVFSPLAPAIATLGASSYTLQGDPVTVLSSVTITDGDSTELSGATVKLTTLSQSGDVLSYTAPQDNPITGTWDAATKTLTLTGTGTLDQYEAALKAVTFTATQGALLVRGVEVSVTDTTGVESIAPGIATINVFSPLAPAIATLGASSYTLQGDPVTVLS